MSNYCAVMDTELKETVYAAVGALSHDSIKPEQEIAFLQPVSLLQGHDVFVSLPTGYGRSLLCCLACCF